VRAGRRHAPFLKGYMDVSNNDACDRSVALGAITNRRNNAHCDREGQQNSLFTEHQRLLLLEACRELEPNVPLSILLDYDSAYAEFVSTCGFVFLRVGFPDRLLVMVILLIL